MDERLKDIIELLIQKTKEKRVNWIKNDGTFFIYLKDRLIYISCGYHDNSYRFDIVHEDYTPRIYEKSYPDHHELQPLLKKLYFFADAHYDKKDMLLEDVLKEIEESEFIGEKEEL
jgi:hypothetical protein